MRSALQDRQVPENCGFHASCLWRERASVRQHGSVRTEGVTAADNRRSHEPDTFCNAAIGSSHRRAYVRDAETGSGCADELPLQCNRSVRRYQLRTSIGGPLTPRNRGTLQFAWNSASLPGRRNRCRWPGLPRPAQDRIRWQIVADDVVGQHADAEPGFHRAAQAIDGIDAEGMAGRGSPAVRGRPVPANSRSSRKLGTGPNTRILWLSRSASGLRQAVFLDVVGRGIDVDVHGEQLALDQVGLCRPAQADGHIGLAHGEVELRRRSAAARPGSRDRARGTRAMPRGQPGGAKADGGGDPQVARSACPGSRSAGLGPLASLVNTSCAVR